MRPNPSIPEARRLLDPDYFASEGYPWSVWARLRREDPVHRVEDWGGDPYWAITRQQELIAISKRPEIFSNPMRFTMAPYSEDAGVTGKNLLSMNPPEHHVYRSIVSKRFTPRALQSFYVRIDQITNAVLDAVATHDEVGELDFVEAVAAQIPIWVIAEMLGIPTQDWKLLYDWTNLAAGANDPEYQQGQTPLETRQRAVTEMAQYFGALVADRRVRPRDDMTSQLANSRIDGMPMDSDVLLTYLTILLVAGNETTRNAISGGLLAMIENPDQMELARRDPSLIEPLVEEVLRFTSPVIHMCRTATEDTQVGNRKIRAGELLTLFFPSANRDEAVFEDPTIFRIERRPNRHLAFGIGEHVCLGSHVARLELCAVFRHLVRRLEFAEVAGPVARLRENSVGGIKHLPLRYRLRPSA